MNWAKEKKGKPLEGGRIAFSFSIFQFHVALFPFLPRFSWILATFSSPFTPGHSFHPLSPFLPPPYPVSSFFQHELTRSMDNGTEENLLFKPYFIDTLEILVD